MPRAAHATAATAATAVLASVLVVAAPAQAALPSRQQWVSDVQQAVYGARYHVRLRVAARRSGERLAINLDIDNTSLESHYRPGAPVPAVLDLATYAARRHVTLLFNTGRSGSSLRAAASQLRAAGFQVGEVCGKASSSEGLAHSKQRCRQRFAGEGYTLIQNVGNRSTDFTGAGYERAYRLPNYGNQLS